MDRLPAAALPAHLQRYVVDQDYASYTPRDQAVWRHIMRRLRSHLDGRAHPVYLKGLDATGIDLERIPRLETMNEKLAPLGWSAVGVRGFIPPAVFTEMQARGVLAIAADIRSHEHIAYTPAPDIVHESAGHAPIIADAAYARFLKAAGEVGFKAIASAEDRAMFEAIRNLSVVKEDPFSTREDVVHAENRLSAAAASVRYVSESTRASRLYWWTAEYGMVGTPEQPRLYGAGLLSSIGEAEHCLTSAVRKVPLSLVCTTTAYDITRMQPQLFVARDFDHLNDVLDEFRDTLAWVRGGDFGLDEALRSHTVNHLVLKKPTGDLLELSGEVLQVHRFGRETGPNLTAAVIELGGPVMLSKGGVTTEGPKKNNAVVLIGTERLPARGHFSFTLKSGVEVSGFVVEGHEVIDFSAWYAGKPLPVPTWAFVAIAQSIPSVAGGPADPATWDTHFGQLDSFTAGTSEALARKRKADELAPTTAQAYRDVASLRATKTPDLKHLELLRKEFKDEPLLQEEIVELLERRN
ncbi:MAG: aromatic amino acid hydroxylase [Myxococcaceae bacterium]|nr:aromatic amino acid hydroxylase [Myxococcaceae bacterium]